MSKAIRILYLHRTAGTRVEGVHIREIVKHLRLLGHEVRLLNPPGCDPMKDTPAETAPQKPALARRLIRRLPRLLPALCFELLEIAWSIALIPIVCWRAWRFKPDFIYERASTFQFAAALVGRLLRFPVIQEINQTPDIGRVRKVRLIFLARALERWTFRHSGALITVSARFRQMLIERGYDPDKIHVIPNAADTDAFRPNLAPTENFQPPPDGSVVLGYVGAFHHWHSLDRLLELVTDARASAGPGIHLLLIGDGPDRERLTNRAAELGIESAVTFTGSLPHAQLPGYIMRMDAAVMADATDYASPVKMFEYMAMGRAIVAPAVPPIREILADGDSAVFFQPHDVDSFKQAVRRVVTDAALRCRLAANARRLAEERHTWRKNAERTIHLAHQLLRTAKG